MNFNVDDLSGLIYSIATTFTNDKTLLNDLYQQGMIGVLNACKNYKSECGTKFSTYARMYIYGEIYKYINCNKVVMINKDVVNLYCLILKTSDLLTQDLKKEPSIKDIAKYLNMDEYTISSTIDLMRNPLSMEYEYEENNTLENKFRTIESDNSIVVNELLNELNPEEKELIIHRYFEGYSQNETAKLMNMSQSGVSRSEARSLEKMKVRIRS
jgi:RNA polymerase sporulation-specific sigma factor